MGINSAPRTAPGYMSEQPGVFGNTVFDILETIPDLVWPGSVQTYAKMRTDPQLAAVLNAYTLPLRQAPKYADPAGCRDEVVQQVSDDLGIPILGGDDTPGPARRRGVKFDDHFRLALLCLVFGHMPFAMRFDILGTPQRARLAELGERMPSTITQIFTNDDGSLKDIIQFGNMTPIPANNLLWYSHEREGAAWQGRSMLRPAYGAWLLKHEMWRVLATGNRRFSMGVPNITAPIGGTPQQVEQAALLASSMRVGDQAGIGLPDGFKLNLTGITGSVPDTLAFIRYLDGMMAQMALASVLNLDSSPNGSRALGATFVDLLLTSLNAIGKEMAGTLTELSVRIVDYNYGEDEPAPRIVVGDAGSRPEVTSLSISDLMKYGAITPDPALEAWVRDRWDMPEREDVPEPPVPVPALPPEATGQPTNPPVPDVPPVPEPEPVTAAARRSRRTAAALRLASGRSVAYAAGGPVAGHRELTAVEAASGVDPAVIDKTWNSRLDLLVNQWLATQPDHDAAIEKQIKAAITANDPTRLAALDVPAKDVAALLASAMDIMTSDAADEMTAEIESQGITVGAVHLDTKRSKPLSETIATIIVSGYAAAAGRQALRLWQPGKSGSSPSDVAGSTLDYLATLTDNYLRTQLGNALSMAQNDGRNAVMLAAPSGATYYASEVLDSNTCKPCENIDGTQFDNQAEAAETYSSGGYMDCQGGLRCRGIVVAVYGG